MLQTFRLIQSGSCDAATNMAVDEALFLSYKEGFSLPTFRLYGWKQPALTIGYSQKPEEILDLETCRQEKMPVVRRPTGGGVIFHDREITYSIVASRSDLGLSCGVGKSFLRISSFLLLAYRSLGADACFAKDTAQGQPDRRFLSEFCFSRKENCDILVSGKKLGGSAQKRQKNLILQHGCIPLSFDPDRARRFLRRPGAEPLQMTTIDEIAGLRLGFDGLADILIRSFCLHFKTEIVKSDLTDEERLSAEELKISKYENPGWNLSTSGLNLPRPEGRGLRAVEVPTRCVLSANQRGSAEESILTRAAGPALF